MTAIVHPPVSLLEQMNAMSEAVDAVCKELGLDAHNSLSREIVAHELMECARHEHDPDRICEIVVDELKDGQLRQ